MITITDQILLSLCLPLDNKLSNLIIDGGNVIVETQEQYLTRVDLNCRELGMQVNFLSPANLYPINEFITKSQSGEIKNTIYRFSKSIADDGFIQDIALGHAIYNSLQEALTDTSGFRYKGQTVGILNDGVVVEYWFQAGINDSDLIVKGSGGSVIITTDDADVFDSNKEGGYPEGAIVSYVNPGSPDPKYQVIAVYVAETQLGYVGVYPSGYVASPEQNDAWIWQGEEVQIQQGSTANGAVQDITSLRLITAPKHGHTMMVTSTASIYKFNSYITSGGASPFDGTPGAWSGIATLPLQNKLLSVITVSNTGELLYVPESYQVLTLEDNVEFTVMNEAGDEMITLVIPTPSIVTRINSGYSFTDFTITPILEGSTTVITVDDADVFDPQKEDGYIEGSIVSYVNVDSLDPKFQTIAVYVAETQINYVGIPPSGYVANPEQNDAWVWQGEEVVIPTGTGSTVFVISTTALQQITGYKVGDTVSVMNGHTYRYQYVNSFDPLSDLYPFDQVGNPNYCWTYRFYVNNLGLRPKINYSGLREAVYGDDHDGAGVTLEMGECIVLLDSTSSVQVNETTFFNQAPCVIYNRLNGTGLEVIEFGGGGSTIISKTYAELQALVVSNGLVQGQQYLLNDYRTKHVIPNSDPVELNTGVLEPLILTATSTNEFHVEVKSTTFPTDIIHYRFDDDSCEDGTRDSVNKKWVGGTPRTGYISYRKSTNNNLSTYYDWRNYKVRRWKLDAIEWVSGDIYTERSVAKSLIDNNIYICKEQTSELDVTDPKNDIKWQLYLDLTIQNSGGFLSPINNSVNYSIGNINPANIIINNNLPNTDYADYYTFSILTELDNSSGIVKTSTNNGEIGEGYKEFSIGKFDYEFSNTWGYLTDAYGANVFLLNPNGSNEKGCCNVSILNDSSDNSVVCKYISNVVIGGLFQLNIINALDFSFNIIEDQFTRNIFNGYATYNKLHSDISSNISSGTFTYNIVKYNFYRNIINGFQQNSVCENVGNISWISSSLVSQQYSTTIFKNSAGVNRLSYYDANDQLVITDITA